jgi:glutamate-1-semialdehyde aminotransferase
MHMMKLTQNPKRAYLKEALKYIPSAAQTLSKNPSQYVVGVTPVAAVRGRGPYIWDVEGDRYLDVVLALGPMVLGYGNKAVDAAVIAQIKKGPVFSIPADRELELAKLLREVVPCAEMSRFYLNGNDATSGAIRLARHITKRAHIAKCGYHGWQDWSIGTKEGRNAGVPDLVKMMTHDFVYNNIDSLEKIFVEFPDQIAAVIMEPTSSEKPRPGFLKAVKALAHKHGAILIFDEMVTGFRWSLGGAQEYFGVTPDLAAFGKAISNGYPVSVICGKAKYMKHMDEVFVSMTFAGYALGLAAAVATIKEMKQLGDVQKHLHTVGDYFIKEANKIAEHHGTPINFVGYGPHPVMQVLIKDDLTSRILKSYIYQEFNKMGILFNASILFGYMHKRKEVDMLLRALEHICASIEDISDYSKLVKRLEGDVAAPRAVRS